MKMPFLQALGTEMQKLHSETEDDAKKALEDIQAAREHKNTVFARGKGKVKEIRAAVSEYSGFIDDLDKAIGDNGDPTPPSDDSSESSAVTAPPPQPPLPEPQASWANKQS